MTRYPLVVFGIIGDKDHAVVQGFPSRARS